MARAVIGPEIDRLIQLIGKLPGLGPRSARRAALALIKRKTQLLDPLADAMELVRARLVLCERCGNIDTATPCGMCLDPRRSSEVLVVIADVGDLWALERAEAHKGRYHILGGLLSPLDGMGPSELHLETLLERIEEEGTTEVILALSATIDGQTTGHYIADLLQEKAIKISRLAQGVPVGGELDYLDESTLSTAFRSRQAF